jgi:hypothetical protein
MWMRFGSTTSGYHFDGFEGVSGGGVVEREGGS